MAKPAFKNLHIDCWVHPRKLGVMQPSLCLFHASAAIGTELLHAITELKGQFGPAQRTLTFKGCSRKLALCQLTFLLVPKREDLKVMNIRRDTDTATIEMTDDGFALLTDAVALWLPGAEDCGVSPRQSSLNPKQFGRLDQESGGLWLWGPGYAGP